MRVPSFVDSTDATLTAPLPSPSALANETLKARLSSSLDSRLPMTTFAGVLFGSLTEICSYLVISTLWTLVWAAGLTSLVSSARNSWHQVPQLCPATGVGTSAGEGADEVPAVGAEIIVVPSTAPTFENCVYQKHREDAHCNPTADPDLDSDPDISLKDW